jgi:thiol-disulfide isomerase/thioredoxin
MPDEPQVSPRTPNSRWRRWLPRLLMMAAIVAAGVLAGKYVGHQFARSAPSASAAGGEAVYGVSLPDLGGTQQSLRQWQGKVLMVNFWATWCAPCREEMPELVAAQAKYGAKGLQIVGIGIDDAAKMRQFTDSIRLNYPALDGGYGALELSKTLGNSAMALPFTVVVDRKGVIAVQQLGPLTHEHLESIAAQLL